MSNDMLEAAAEGFRTLGHPIRLRVLTTLRDECQPVHAIVAALALPQPLVSHHLRLLKEQGL
ncbi:MAG: ArsR/SmtB family transcription factor, partial [Clostridia bacterium]